MQEIIDHLMKLKDDEYADFQVKLTPGLKRCDVLGVRNPLQREYAKELFKNQALTKEFLNELPHKYYDENMLHALLLEQIKDYDEVISELDKFLPYVDNWAVCDTMKPKCFKKNLDKLLVKIKEWIKSDKEYTIRFAIKLLMMFYLDSEFDNKYLEIVSNVEYDSYYVNMMAAWYFATALAKKWDETIKVIESKNLRSFIQNKTIQKAIESYRITDSQKEYLRTLRK